MIAGWRLRQKERESVREMKGLVTNGENLCVVRYVELRHAVIKSSPRLTARHLFTEDFNFPDSPFPLYPLLHPPPPLLALYLTFCLYFSPSVPFVLLCYLSLSLRFTSVPRSLNPVCTNNNKLSGAAQLQKLHIFFCKNPFVLSSFIFVYLHRPEGKELLERLGNAVCAFLNLALG